MCHEKPKLAPLEKLLPFFCVYLRAPGFPAIWCQNRSSWLLVFIVRNFVTMKNRWKRTYFFDGEATILQHFLRWNARFPCVFDVSSRQFSANLRGSNYYLLDRVHVPSVKMQLADSKTACTRDWREIAIYKYIHGENYGNEPADGVNF
ncbi:hypothetical protein ACFE04_008648 [Oxalis oulophora]